MHRYFGCQPEISAEFKAPLSVTPSFLGFSPHFPAVVIAWDQKDCGLFRIQPTYVAQTGNSQTKNCKIKNFSLYLPFILGLIFLFNFLFVIFQLPLMFSLGVFGVFVCLLARLLIQEQIPIILMLHYLFQLYGILT